MPYYFDTSSEFFTPALTDGLPLENEWQQISFWFQDSPQYSSSSQQCWTLDGLNSFSDVQLFHSPFLTQGDHCRRTNYNWYHRPSHVSQLSKFYEKVQVFISHFVFFDFYSVCCMGWYNYTYTYIRGNIINNNDERTHLFRKIYLSHFILERVAKGLCVRGELETEHTARYWPQVPLTIAALLSHSAGLLNRGHWGSKPSAGNWFSLPRTATRTPTNWLHLTRTVCGTGLYNSFTTTCFLWASHLHRIQPVHMSRWYLRPGASVSWLTACSKVNMLHVVRWDESSLFSFFNFFSVNYHLVWSSGRD